MTRPLLYQKCVSTLSFDFAATPVTTAAWVQLDAALDEPCVAAEILNTSNAILQLSVGIMGAENNDILDYLVLPGKSSPAIPLELARGQRLSARAIDAIDADIGNLYINFLG